jgi:hypothetical protein
MNFTMEQFFNVFTQYNTAVWPAQVFFYLLALAALFLAVKQPKYSNRIISAVLAFFWLWMGAVYHLAYFTSINPGAYLFAALFIAQAILFFLAGVLRPKLSFNPRPDV